MPTGAAWGVICLCLAAPWRMDGIRPLPSGKKGQRACLDEGGPACRRLRLLRLDGAIRLLPSGKQGAFFRSRVRAIITGGRGLPGDVEVCFMPAGIDETIFDHEDGQLPIMSVMLNNKCPFLTFA